MVDGQLRPNRVTDPRLIAAMLELPREAFLPEALASRAYADARIELAPGRSMLSPMVQAWLVGSLELREDDRVLVLPALGGYLAAVAARLAREVVTVEREPGLLALARRALAQHAAAVRLVEGDPAQGAPGEGKFTALVIEGRVERLPDGLLGLLSEGARIATILGSEGGGAGHLAIGPVLGGRASLRPREDAAASVLPEFADAPSFAF